MTTIVLGHWSNPLNISFMLIETMLIKSSFLLSMLWGKTVVDVGCGGALVESKPFDRRVVILIPL